MKTYPPSFLNSFCWRLKNQGILQSKKGKGGGYFLARPPHSVSVGQIVRMVDGPLAPLPCVSRTSYMRCRECRDERSCGIRIVMKDVRDATARILDSTTLADVLKRVEAVVQGKEGLALRDLIFFGAYSLVTRWGKLYEAGRKQTLR